VRVPLERGAVAEPAAEQPTASGLAECRVLLADANPLSQAVIRAVLQAQVRAVEVVGSGDEACEAVRGGRFDVVLIEAAALGVETAERLAAMRGLAEAAGPADIVVLIGDAREDELAGLSAAGAVQIVRKPITGPALVAALREGHAARHSSAVAAAERPDASAA
jgi:CheY-like chemotaxis protein